MSRRMWMARVLPAALAVAVLVGSSVTVGLHFLSARANSHAASAQMHWPAIDHKAEQQYWALRNGNMTGAALQAAEAQAAKLPQASKLPPTNHVGGSTGGMTPGNPGGGWTGIGPSPIDTGGGPSNYYAGRVSALAVDQTTSGASTTIYLGSAGGGVWKSTNNGGKWTPLTDTQSSLATGAIAIDPNNHNTIYVGTGEPNQSGDSHFGTGVLKSTNGGASWTLYGAAQFDRNVITKIIVNPYDSTQLWVAAGDGLYVSTDSGQTYNLVGGGLPSGSPVWDLGIDPTANPVTLDATLDTNGFYRSTDGGATWNNITTGLTSVNWTGNRSALAVAPSNPSVLYLVVINSNYDVYTGSYNGGYYSTNGGASWSPMASLNQNFVDGGYGSQGWYDLYLAVDPKNDETVYGGGVDVALTTNARGATGNWQNITSVYGSDNSGIHPDQHAIAFPACSAAPCPAYFGNDGGIYFSSNTTTVSAASVTYSDLNSAGLDISTFTGGDINGNFADGHLAIGGTQDDGTMVYTGNPIQPEVYGGDGGFAQIDRSIPSTMYTENFGISLVKSTNGGATWNDATNGLGGSSLFYSPFTLDRLNDQHLVAGTSAVYETTNGAGSWYPSSGDLREFTNDAVSAVAVAPANSAVIWAGMAFGQVYRTTNGNTGTTATWTDTAFAGNDGTYYYYVTSIAVDPNDTTGMTAFVTVGNFFAPSSGHIFKTTDGGANWTDISNSLGNAIPANSAVVYYSGATRVLVVGTDVGVFFTTNDGTSWSQLSGIPNSPVEQLAVDGARTTIMAFTHGRGEWTLNIPNADKTAGTGDTPGIYRPSNGRFYLRNTLTTGFADETARFGPTGAGIYPVTGDWTGSGVDRPGIYDSTHGVFYLAADNSATPALLTSFHFGNPGDVPLVGDWNGDGVDGVGVFRPTNGVIYLRNALSTGFADYAMVYGNPGDVPLAGDWSGQGHDTMGIYRPSTHKFYLTNTNCNKCIPTTNYQVTFGVAGDTPFVGDWTHAGHSGLGVFRTSNGLIYMRNDATTTGFANYSMVLGIANDQPVAGHWT